jgi:hypothetical protein
MRFKDTAFDVTLILVPSPHPLLHPRSLYLLAFPTLTLLLSSTLILTPTLTLILTFLSPVTIPLGLCPLRTMSIPRLSFPVNRRLLPLPHLHRLTSLLS